MEIVAEHPMDRKFGDLALEDPKAYEKLRDIPMSNTMSYRRPHSRNNCWTFWSNSACNNWVYPYNRIITEKIKSALVDDIPAWCGGDEVLIQFWAAMRTEEGCVKLVTSNQPFALSHHFDQGLVKYRKHCLDYEINVDGPEELLGIPGRVFRNKWHEIITDWKYYSNKEYPQRDLAATCDIKCSHAFPVFDPSYDGCLGVLEFISYRRYYPSVFLMGKALKIDTDDYYESIMEIKRGLEAVCVTHSLPVALTRTPCNAKSLDDDITQVLHFEHEASCSLDERLIDSLSRYNDLQKGQGVAGMAYMLGKPCFCKDITQFTITQYPLLPYARHWGLTGCFAVCLQNACTKNCDFVLEFFLPRGYTYGEHPSTFLPSILETMMQHFPRFKVDPQLVLDPDGINNGRNVVNAEENNIDFCRSNDARVNQNLASFQCQSTRSPPGLGDLKKRQETMQPHSSNQQQIIEVDGINKGRNVANAKQHEADSITYEEIAKHFGKKLEDVAKIFEVSRSTFKRRCRDMGINHWKKGKRTRRDALCSDFPTEKQVATVITPPEVCTTTIKATYGAHMFKFQLSSASRMEELEENVFKRLKLDAGTYDITYNDGEDQISIACDEDLQLCLSASEPLSMDTIKMVIEPITKICPST